jgi:hypothetical protein
MSIAKTVAAWRVWLMTPSGLVYLARRVRIGAREAHREQAQLEAWFRGRL